jgi:hypothetical protein
MLNQIIKIKSKKIYEETHNALKLADLFRLVDGCSREQLKFLNHIVDSKKIELSRLEKIKGCYWKATKINPNDPSKFYPYANTGCRSSIVLRLRG